jgi:mycothiol synthase
VTPATTVTRIEPDDFEWPSPEGPAAQVRRVAAAAAAADGRDPLNEATLLSLRHHGLSSATLFLAGPSVAELATHQPVQGFALVLGPPGAAELTLVVDPAARCRGVGSALASAVLSSAPPAGLSAWSHGNHPGAAALAASTGFTRVRDLWVMRRSLRTPLPAVVPVAGVDVRPFRPGDDEEAFLAVNAAAFAHHREQGSMTREDLAERMGEHWFDPAGCFLAWSSTGRLLGFHWTKVHTEGRPPFGEVYVVGISPAEQGLGLGRLLTLTGLHHLASLGLDEVILYVESDNAAAVRVYERLGFRHEDRDTDVMYAR